MNRGIACRTLFEGPADIRFFLSRLARAVRRGSLEVHAYCVMTTHFHLLVRSPIGELSEVMRQVQLDYVRRFNRERHRDGPLLRGRFTSKPVTSLLYRKILVRYIDRNPVQARICGDPREYPFGSAFHYSREKGPPWLERSWVESVVQEITDRKTYSSPDYARAFNGASGAEERLVEIRLSSAGHADPLDDLVHATPVQVLSWMRWKARLADGTEPGLPVVEPGCVDDVVHRERDRGAEILLRAGRADLLTEIHAGLLRGLSGASLAEIGERTGRSTSNAGALCQRHARRLEQDEAYARHASGLGKAAIDAQVGSSTIPLR